MKEPKKSANWYIAATHFLTAGFAIPLIGSLIFGFIIAPLLVRIDSVLLVAASSLIITALAVWFGVMYSARYLKRTYIIEDKGKIVRFSIAYLIVLSIGFLLLQIFLGKPGDMDILFNISNLGLRAVLFYVASNKYITYNAYAKTAS